MKLITISGLRGTLVEYVSTDVDHTGGYAIVKRDDAPFEAAPYSTHFVYQNMGHMVAETGHYDLTLEQARADLNARVGR